MQNTFIKLTQMKKTLACLTLVALTLSLHAQSKIFKEIAGSVKSDLNEIRESGSVVGYLSLVQIEKTDKDSFNYDIKIMDENLNDMGEVKFKDIDLDMQSVAFENNVLCLSFAKFKKEKVKRREKIGISYAQYFINLQGEIINKYETPASSGIEPQAFNINVPTKGFVVFIKDKKENKFLEFDNGGKLKWEQGVKDILPGTLQATSKVFGYFNSVKNTFEFYDVDDPKKTVSVAPKTPKKMYYNLLTLQNIDNKLIYAGSLRHYKEYSQMKEIRRGMDKGVFALEVSGLEKNDIKERVNYWGDGHSDLLKRNSAFQENKKVQAVFANAVADKTGNVFFYSTNLRKKPKIGSIIATVVTLPTIVVPFLLSSLGYTKYNYDNASIFMLDPKNNLKVYDELETEKSATMVGKSPVGYAMPYVMKASNSESNDTHFIVSEANEYKIYNVANKKSKSFPSNKKGITTRVYSAKDGYVLVVENNQKAKETKLSIVAL